MNTFFDETGGLNIDEIIIKQPSFLKIMADGKVTNEELQEQSQRVIAILKNIEQTADPELIEKVRELLAELCVLIAAKDIFTDQEKE